VRLYRQDAGGDEVIVVDIFGKRLMVMGRWVYRLYKPSGRHSSSGFKRIMKEFTDIGTLSKELLADLPFEFSTLCSPRDVSDSTFNARNLLTWLRQSCSIITTMIFFPYFSFASTPTALSAVDPTFEYLLKLFASGKGVLNKTYQRPSIHQNENRDAVAGFLPVYESAAYAVSGSQDPRVEVPSPDGRTA